MCNANDILEELSSCALLCAALVLRMAEGLFARVAITPFMNYYIFTIIGPVVFGLDYLDFGQKPLQSTLKLRFFAPEDILAPMLVYASIFNILKALLAIMFRISSSLLSQPQYAEVDLGNPWVSNFTKHRA